MKLTLSIVAFLCLTCSGILAQQPENVSITFSVVGWGKALESISYREGSKLKEINSIPLFQRSESVSYRGAPSIRFYLPKVEQAPQGDEPNSAPRPQAVESNSDPLPVAIASIPPGAKRVLILLSPKDSQQYDAIAIPDDTDAIPAGKGLLINLCGETVAVRTNKSDSFMIEPGARRLLNTMGKSLMLLQLELANKNSGKWMKFENSFLPLPPSQQTMIFLLRSDSNYFQDVDGNIRQPVQMVVLRAPVESSASDSQVDQR